MTPDPAAALRRPSRSAAQRVAASARRSGSRPARSGSGPSPTSASPSRRPGRSSRRIARSSLVFNRSDLQSAFPEADGGWVGGPRAATARAQRPGALRQPRADEARPRDRRRPRVLPGPRRRPRPLLTRGVRCAADLAAIPAPRVGFFGGLDDYVVDLDLLRETAEALPDASIVLIGDATCSMDELAAVPNVHWLGYQPYADIPSFGRGFDVAIMPWLDNEWIRFANPIKLKEYLALGLAGRHHRLPRGRGLPRPGTRGCDGGRTSRAWSRRPSRTAATRRYVGARCWPSPGGSERPRCRR